MRFYRIEKPILFQYHLNVDTPLANVDVVSDLGVTFQRDLGFECHIDRICNRALKLLGFVIRNVRDFQEIGSIRSVYCGIVRSVLEYGVSVWTPQYNKYIVQIERVQKKFLRFIAYKLNVSHDVVGYDFLLGVCNLETLEKRRQNYDLCLLYKIVNNLIDSPDLLEQISYHVPARDTRQNVLFDIEFHRTNYGFHSPLTRMMRLGNDCSLDMSHLSYSVFKHSL